MIDIRDIQGSVIYSTEINVGSKRKFTLMKEDYITLRFSLEKPINFPLGTKVDDASVGLFEVVDLQKPTINNSTGGYDYELRLDSYYWKWKNKIFKFTPKNGWQEASWSLTAKLNVHLNILIENLKALGYDYRGYDFEYHIDSTVVDKSVAMTYENMNIIDALTALAEAYECEWWVTDNVIHFGRCEYGSSVDFEIGGNVAEMTRSESHTNYATRLYVFGSTRNLPPTYRPAEEQIVANGVVQKRLMLPKETPVLNSVEGMSEEEAVEEVVIIEDVYPKMNGLISEIEIVERVIEEETQEEEDTGDESQEGEDEDIENAEGEEPKEEKKQKYYRFRDNGFQFSEELILEGQELKVIFESGLLNGMEFGVVFNPDRKDENIKNEDTGESVSNPLAQVFEIVVNENYGRLLPDDTLYPQVEDKYVLVGWDATKGLGELVENAEIELYNRGVNILEKRKIDPSTYSCKMFSDYMYGLDPDGNLNPDYAKHFEVGDRVKLINEAYFPNGRESRIIGYEYFLDFKYDNPIYIVGEKAAYSRLGELEEKLDAITLAGQTYTGGSGGSGIYLIGTNDIVLPSNRNAYSALKADSRFLKRDGDDRSRGKIASDKGFEVGRYVSGSSGAIAYLDTSTGKTVAEIDKLYVRMKAYFETLVIKEANSIGGKQIISPAGAVRLTDVANGEWEYDEKGEPLLDEEGNHIFIPYDGFVRCYFLAEQDGERINHPFEIGDQMYCQLFNAFTGEGNGISNKYYWRLLVNDGGKESVKFNNKTCYYFDLSNTICDTGSDMPEVGDIVCQRGNIKDSDRQNFLEFSSVDAFSPNITLFQGVGGRFNEETGEWIADYTLTDKEMVQFAVNKSTGRAFMNLYGDMYVGGRFTVDANGSPVEPKSYLRYTQENGLEIKGKISAQSTYGDSDKTLGDYFNDVFGDIEGIQKQIDGAIESFFYEYAPALDNYPASEWITDALKEAHLNDTFTNLKDGRSWRWTKSDGVYSWTEITDTATVEALRKAGEAQDTADGKRKVYVGMNNPTTPYDEGDLWSRGSTYPLLVCINPKEADQFYERTDWVNADNIDEVSKELEEAKKQFEQDIKDNAEDLKTLSDLLQDTKDYLDGAFKDGIIDSNEKSAISKYINQIETIQAEVEASYTEVYNNELLLDDGDKSTAKQNLATAYDKLIASITDLIDTINSVIGDNKVDGDEISSVDFKYEAFNQKYGEYVKALNAARNHIEFKINGKIDQNIEDLGGYAYLKDVLKDGKTLMNGGLIQSSILALGNFDNKVGSFTVWSGTSGIYDGTKIGGGIASWYGGGNIDLFDYASYDNIGNVSFNVPEGLRVAAGVDRMDGTGYRANGNLWWDKDGKVHADSLSFFVGEESVGNLLASFQPISDNDGKLLYIIPQAPFQNLQVTDAFTVGSGDNKVALKYDKDNNALYVVKPDGSPVNFYATGGISMYGKGDTTVKSVMDLITNNLDPSTLAVHNGLITVIGNTGSEGVSESAVRNIVEGYGFLTDVPSEYITESELASKDYAGKEWVKQYVVDVNSGSITTITRQMVIDALGFTPYSAENPNGYITSATLGGYLSLTGGMMRGDVVWGNGTGVNSIFPSHIYRNLYNAEGNVYDHFFPHGDSLATNTFANLRVWDNSEKTIKVLRFGGDGTFTWAGNTIIHSGNIGSYALPLSGGTITSSDGAPLNINSIAGYTVIGLQINGINYSEFGADEYWGTFLGTAGKNQKLGIKPDGTPYYNEYSLIHSGNIGSQSVYYATSSENATNALNTKLLVYNYTSPNVPLGMGEIAYSLVSKSDAGYLPADYNANGVLTLNTHQGNYYYQLGFSSNGNIYGRFSGGYELSDSIAWKQIAFTDSNVASATKLQTARTIWGQSFDGTSDVKGNINLNTSFLCWHNDPTNFSINGNTGNLVYTGFYGHKFCTRNGEVLTITDGGNVGIGTTNPLDKLHVAGNLRLKNDDSYYGNYIFFGEDRYCYIGEITDDSMTIYASKGIQLMGKVNITSDTTIDGNLLVRGGITMYRTDGNVTPFLIDVQDWELIDSMSVTQVYTAHVTTLLKEKVKEFGEDVTGLSESLDSKIRAIKTALQNITSNSSVSAIGAALNTLYNSL